MFTHDNKIFFKYQKSMIFKSQKCCKKIEKTLKQEMMGGFNQYKHAGCIEDGKQEQSTSEEFPPSSSSSSIVQMETPVPRTYAAILRRAAGLP